MQVLDMLGKPCPIPVIEAKKALRSTALGESLGILVDNDIARQNLQKMAAGLGYGFAHEEKEDGNILAVITVTENCQLSGDDESGLVVAIGSNIMGGPNEELGKSLMKSFIYSLTELDTPPAQLLFYNAGVKLTTEGSTALADLETLAAKGTEINSCGACLNYYELSDKLKVGSVSNMFAIVSGMSQAKKLINL